MEFDQEKIDEMMLALLYLTSSTDQYGTRAWKGLDAATLTRLHKKGYISDPQSKSPTMLLSEEGARLSKELFIRYFAKKDPD
ncbi:MAG: hypothetical protein GYA20_10135 [Chloroflexi bacterium]|nr:hypothetical protein [Chloroflexota bacterium]